MKSRCYCKSNTSFANYGGRGIKVCDRWLNSFEAFAADMGLPQGEKFILDRIDVNGDYSPENCRWANHLESGQNTTTISKITVNGKTQHAAQWARETGANPGAILTRIKRGETDPEKIFAVGKIQNKTRTNNGKRGNKPNMERAIQMLNSIIEKSENQEKARKALVAATEDYLSAIHRGIPIASLDKPMIQLAEIELEKALDMARQSE